MSSSHLLVPQLLSAAPAEALLPLLELELLAKLVLAVVLGGVVGLEREFLEKPAGLRTNILICLGAAIFTHISSFVGAWGTPSTPVDASRVAAQIVSGIGFLGAGAIIQSRAHVKGLTTAATIWVVAAIGMAVGAEAYVAAVGGTGLILLVLVGLGALERRVDMGWAELEVVVRLDDDRLDLKAAEAWMEEFGLNVSLKEVSRRTEDGRPEARLQMKARRSELRALTEELFSRQEVVRIHPR